MNNSKSLMDKIKECKEKYETCCMEKPNVVEMNCYTFEKLRVEASKSSFYTVDNLFNIFGLELRLKEDIPNNGIVVRKEDKVTIGGFRGGKTPKFNNWFIKLPKKYIINDGATILFWNDGSKTVVKRAKEDEYDKVKGFLWAYFLKTSGMSRTKANKYLAELLDERELTNDK